jgi:hypothetical protein
MPKILWVALPLLVAAAFLALQLLRGRAPRAPAINIVSSVLLLAYVATTAGLGIFWVANQQLPVFDWHYLFGYGTVLLVSLHLVFNFPTVWRWFARRAEREREPQPVARLAGAGATRRGLLATLGVLAATGAAFWLGLRHGRSELKVEASAGGAAAAPREPSRIGRQRRRRDGARAGRALPRLFDAHARRPPDSLSSARLGRAAAAVQAPCRRAARTAAEAGRARAGRFDLASLAACSGTPPA